MLQGIIFDIDGTVRKHDSVIEGAVACINTLTVPYAFLTNTPDKTSSTVRGELSNIGIKCAPWQVVTCLEATVSRLAPCSVFYIGNTVVGELLKEKGCEITENNPDYVVISWDTECTYSKIETAARLIRNGAKFVATNPDKICFTERGISPGTGALVAAVEAASGRPPIVIGKPASTIVEVALERMKMRADEVLLVGDYLEIDILAGKNAGTKTALLLTGVSKREELFASSVQPDLVQCEIVDRILI